MILVTTDNIPKKEIREVLGLVKGNTVRAKNIGKDLFAGFKNIVGGEIRSYTEMMTESREEAMNRMISEAEALGANAIVGIKFTTSAVMAGAAELLVYGTAVKI